MATVKKLEDAGPFQLGGDPIQAVITQNMEVLFDQFRRNNAAAPACKTTSLWESITPNDWVDFVANAVSLVLLVFCMLSIVYLVRLCKMR